MSRPKMVRQITPRGDDYFVIKPQMSGFYATNLPVLQPRLGISRRLLTGIAADICVLFTAADAHMHAYDLWIICDAVASEDDQKKGLGTGYHAKEHGRRYPFNGRIDHSNSGSAPPSGESSHLSGTSPSQRVSCALKLPPATETLVAARMMFFASPPPRDRQC